MASGDRAYVVGTTDGNFCPMGSHIKGNMGGVWTPPIKLLDGFWFAFDSEWLQPASDFTSLPGAVRMNFSTRSGLEIERTEFSPDGIPVVLIKLSIFNPSQTQRTGVLQLQIRSNLMAAYPWSNSSPAAKDVNDGDLASYSPERGTLTIQEQGKQWFAIIGSSQHPFRGATGDEYWGPVSKAERQSYSENGWGAGGELAWEIAIAPDSRITLWVGVAGSHISEIEAIEALKASLQSPEDLLNTKIQKRTALVSQTAFNLPEPALVEAANWGKLNMADLCMNIPQVEIRDVEEGKAYPAPITTVPLLAGVCDGFPDYVALYGTGSGFIIYPLVVAGMWEPAKAHLRTLRDVSRLINGSTGKVVHEIELDGSVYFGNNRAKGDPDETGLFASAVELLWRWTGDNQFRDEMYEFVKDGMRYVALSLDEDNDLWPTGSGMAERPGMGSEELEVTVATWVGLESLARIAASVGDDATAEWARHRADLMQAQFEHDWWLDEHKLYADSRSNRGDEAPARRQPEWTNVAERPDQPLQQKIWTVLTPLKDELASENHAHQVLDLMETSDFSSPMGLYLVGKGGGADGKGVLMSWTITSAAMALAEARYGRLADHQALLYMRAIAKCLDIEQPGALPELAPSPEYDPYKPLTERMMFMQAWSSYGISWTLITSIFGITPDASASEIIVVPSLPPTWPEIGVNNLRVGDHSMEVGASQRSGRYETTVRAPIGWKLLIGHVVPHDDEVYEVTLNGQSVEYADKASHRGREIQVQTRVNGSTTLVIGTRAKTATVR